MRTVEPAKQPTYYAAMRSSPRKKFIFLLASGALALQALAIAHVFLHAPLGHTDSHCVVCAHGVGLNVLTVSATSVPVVAAPASPPLALGQRSPTPAQPPARRSRSPPAEV